MVSAALVDGLDEEPQTLWEQLWAGDWRVASVQAERIERVVVLRRLGHEEAPLTRAERRVIVLAARSATLKQIADALGIQESTASTHLSRSLRKLGFHHRTELVSLVGVSAKRPPRTDSSNK